MFLWCVQSIIFVWIGSQIFIIHSKFWVDGSCQDGSQQRFLKFVPEKFDQIYSLITSSSHVFHESWINESTIFSTKFYVSFIGGCKASFSAMTNTYSIGIFDLNRKSLPCRKTKLILHSSHFLFFVFGHFWGQSYKNIT